MSNNNKLCFTCLIFAQRALVLAITLALLCPASLSLQAQRRGEPTPAVTYPPQLTAELKQLQQAALTSDYAYRQLAHLTDSIGPRLTGSPQAEAAVEYVAGRDAPSGAGSETRKVVGDALGARRRRPAPWCSIRDRRHRRRKRSC